MSNLEDYGVGGVVPVNDSKPCSITSIDDLRRYAGGAVVRFSDFADGQPFIARVRRPSMMVLAKVGKIPNRLLTAANGLFKEGTSSFDETNEQSLSVMFDLMDVIVDATLVEPKYSEIKEAGVELTDAQMMEIFAYSQNGVDALSDFRILSEDNESVGDGEYVQGPSI